ncbi:MAG: 50S ribosomal protein L17 [Candidatus Omnitrophica bacterium CG1_02_49_10]|nr:MAG: 50S ribosomal protein L17 [Candidatus Omnitrophica bacterium CG1_02_49_10]
MRHRKARGRLSRAYGERQAMFSNMLASLLKHQSVKTTLAKAKYVKRAADKLITLGKRNDLHSRRLAFSILKSRDLVRLLFNEIAPRFSGRNGGYTRVIPADIRKGDGTKMAFLELSEIVIKERPKKKIKEKKAEEEPKPDAKAEKEITHAAAPEKPDRHTVRTVKETRPTAKSHKLFKGLRKIFGRKAGGK